MPDPLTAQIQRVLRGSPLSGLVPLAGARTGTRARWTAAGKRDLFDPSVTQRWPHTGHRNLLLVPVCTTRVVSK